MCCLFFCKQKTAYEMRISDWSSDVCSSDLGPGGSRGKTGRTAGDVRGNAAVVAGRNRPAGRVTNQCPDPSTVEWKLSWLPALRLRRSEERRVGKEGVSTWISRWSPSP